MSKIISIVILQAIFCSTFLTLSHSANPLIESTCKQTPPLYELCVSILSSDPQSSTADVPGLAVIAANVAYSKGKATLNVTQEMLQSATDQKLRSALNSCIDLYDVMVSTDIPAAGDGIKMGDPKFALESAKEVQKDIQICENGFEKTSITKPIFDSNKALHDVVVIFQSIACSLLHRG